MPEPLGGVMQVKVKWAGAKRTKQRILKVAFRLFAEHGYKNVTVDQIIAEAKSSKGAFYNHFPSKNHLIYEHIRFKDARYEELTEHLGCIALAGDKLRFFGEGLFRLLGEMPELSATLLTLDINYPEVAAMFQDDNRYLYKLLTPIFDVGLELGHLVSPLPTSDLIDAFLAVTTGVEVRWCIRECKFDIVEYGNRVVDIFVRGLEPPV